jgi:hypothetical protein
MLLLIMFVVILCTSQFPFHSLIYIKLSSTLLFTQCVFTHVKPCIDCARLPRAVDTRLNMLLKILAFALYTSPLSVQALQSRSCLFYLSYATTAA